VPEEARLARPRAKTPEEGAIELLRKFPVQTMLPTVKLPPLAVFLSLCVAAVCPEQARASFTAWFLAHKADWDFIQSTGGIRVLKPEEAGGRIRLPVLYDASGSTATTCKPTAANTGLVVDKIKVRREAARLVIRILTLPVKDSGSTEGTGQLHYADLTGFPPGIYDVYYARADDRSTWLGQIELKAGPGRASDS